MIGSWTTDLRHAWRALLRTPGFFVTSVGILALAFWWVVVVAGLLVLVRWLPSSGKHASGGQEDSWSEGPGLSVLAHVGMLVGVCVFTYAYLTSAV